MSPENVEARRLKIIPSVPGPADVPPEEGGAVYAVTAALVVVTIVLSVLSALGAVWLVLQPQ